MCKIYTAQYRIKDNDRLDITYLGKDKIGKIFAPDKDEVWKYRMDIVQARNQDEILKAEKEYTLSYLEKMRTSYHDMKYLWKEVLQRDRLVLVCFCKAGDFCHRVILAGIMEKAARQFGMEAEYLGEIADIS